MSNFNRRRRNQIFGLIVALGLVPSLGVGLSGLVGINPRDIQFFSADYRAEYSTAKGLEKRGPIQMRSQGQSRLLIREGTREEEFAFTREGTYLDQGKDTGTYPILWVRFPPQEKMNRPRQFMELVNQLRVTDLTGLIGPRGAVYRLHNQTTTIFWSWLVGSQFSHPADLLDEQGQVKASGIYDTTCGILEELTAFKDGAMGTITLTGTDFPMSRNRNLTILYTFILTGILLLYHFIWRRKNIPDPILFRLESDLIVLGILAVLVDEWADIWFFHYLGPRGLIILHLLTAAFVLWRFGFWVILPLLELAWALAFAEASRSIIPQLAFCPGLFFTWFALIQFHSFRNRFQQRKVEPPAKEAAIGSGV